MKKLLFSLLSLTLSLSAAQENEKIDISTWSIEEKIGQLIMAAAVSNEALNKEFMQISCYTMHKEYVSELIEKYHIGGIIFLGKGTIESQIERTRYFQSLSKIPLLIGQDLEPGLASRRVIDGIEVPFANELGKQSDQHVYEYAKQIAEQAKKLGVHIVFAPVVDVNTNPKNPVIGKRAFGDTKELVTQKALAFMRGLQDAGIIACAKHFPGHGDTSTDSHETLPCIVHNYERIVDVELYPFKKLIEAGIQAVMLAHLVVPALDPSRMPTSLSRAVITDLLKRKLGFTDLVVTDGLGMRALTDHYSHGQIAVMALQAGTDLLLCPVDVPDAVQAIKEALASGELKESELDEHVIKVMKIKQKIK